MFVDGRRGDPQHPIRDHLRFGLADQVYVHIYRLAVDTWMLDVAICENRWTDLDPEHPVRDHLPPQTAHQSIYVRTDQSIYVRTDQNSPSMFDQSIYVL